MSAEIFLSVIVTGLACRGLTSVWLGGEIFADARSRVEIIENWLLRTLLLCQFCLSVHICLILSLIVFDYQHIPARLLLAHWLASIMIANQPWLMYETNKPIIIPDGDAEDEWKKNEDILNNDDS